MPDLILKSTGKPAYVPAERIEDAIASGLYETPSSDTQVPVVQPGALGDVAATTLGDLERSPGLRIETTPEFRAREREARLAREHGGVGGKIATGIENAVDEASLGLYGVAADAIGGEQYRENRLERSEANPNAALVGKGAGIIASTIETGGTGLAGKAAKAAKYTPLSTVTRLGGKIAHAGEDASALAKAGRAIAGSAFEGAAQGVGGAIQQLEASDDPLTWERAATAISSNALLGGVIGAGVGIAGKVASKALGRAKAGLEATATRAEEALAAKTVKAGATEETTALASDLATFRKATIDDKLFLATKGATDREVRSLAKISLDADRQIDRLLRNPKALAEQPKRALTALQQQEHAYEQILSKSDDLKTKFATDETADRVTSLNAISPALERNRALQERIRAASESVAAPAAAGKGISGQLVQGSAFGAITGAVSSVPLLGQIPGFASLVGAKASQALSEFMSGGLGKATAEAAKRSAKAVDAFLRLGGKLEHTAPVLATEVLGGLRYSTPTKSEAPIAPAKQTTLAKLYKDRAAEIRSHIAIGPDRVPQMRRESREKIAEQLQPVRLANPVLADRMETIAARKVEFLAAKLPRRPDHGAIQIGPDTWQPSDFEMRAFARYAAAAEDPGAVEERLAHGTVTPEDAEVMRELYPEHLAELTANIAARLPELRETLPYSRRLALSILTGVPVDPAMDPEVLSVLQGNFASEPNTSGGAQAPRMAANIGSMKNQEATASQQREIGDR